MSSFLKLKIGFLLLDMINLVGLFSIKSALKSRKEVRFFKTLIVSEPESTYILAIFKILSG